MPDGGYGLGAISDLNNPGLVWYSPGFYNGFTDPPVSTQMGPSVKWTLINSDMLPTADGTQFGAITNTSFFRLSNPAPIQ